MNSLVINSLVMNSLKTFGLAAALIASAASSALAQAQTVTLTAAPASFQGDSTGATAQVGTKGPGSGQNYLDIEGAGNGTKYESFGVIDFIGNSVYDASGVAETIASVDPTITLDFTDASFSQSRPTSLNFYLADGSAPLSSLKYQASDTSATAGVGSQLGNLFFLGAGSYTSTSKTVPGGDLPFTLTLSAAAQSYFIQQLNTDVNPLPGDPATPNLTDLRFVVTAADAANPNGVASFSGATGSGAPTLTFTATPVPEASTPVSLGALLLLGLGSLAVARRRRA